MHPYEWGILGVKAIALLLAIERTIPSPSSTSVGCFACKQDSGRAKALGVRRRCRTAPTGLYRKGGCPVHQLTRSWLQERLTRASVKRASKSKLPIKLSSLGFPECAQANFNFQLFSSQSCKNPKLVKSAQIRLLYVYLTWLAMRLAH
jgi:hypothetical protein